MKKSKKVIKKNEQTVNSIKKPNKPKQQKQLKFGFALFKQSFTMKDKKQLLNKSNSWVFQFQGWYVSENYETGQWKYIFENIQTAQCRQLTLNSTQSNNILSQIVFPVFTCLTQIYLESNGIQSIEALCFIDMSNIKTINLSTNYITQVECLNKLNFKQLEVLRLQQNPIETAVCLSRIRSSVQCFDLDLIKLAMQIGRYMNQDMSFYPKLPGYTSHRKLGKNSLIYYDVTKGKNQYSQFMYDDRYRSYI